MGGDERKKAEEARVKIRAARKSVSVLRIGDLTELIKKTRAIMEKGSMNQRAFLRGTIEELHDEIVRASFSHRNLRVIRGSGEVKTDD
jgi:hypothetical protein